MIEKEIINLTLEDVAKEVNRVRKENDKVLYTSFRGEGEVDAKGKPLKAGKFGGLLLKDLVPELVKHLGDIPLSKIKLLDFVVYADLFGESPNEPIRVYDIIDSALEKKSPDDALSFRQQVRYLLGNFASELNPAQHVNVIPLLPTPKADHLATQSFFRNKRSVKTVTEAGLAIIDEPDRIAKFFIGLDTYAEDTNNKHASAVVDGIKVNALTGFRPSVITHLMESEIIEHSDGTMSLKLQKDKKGMKSDTEEGGKFKSREGQAIKVFVVPLDPYATQILRNRLALLKEDRAKGVKNPEGFLFYNVDPNTKKASAIDTKSTKKFVGVNEVLGEVVVEGGIVEDQKYWDENNKARRHDTLYVKGLNKSGAELLRNMNTHIRIESGMSPHDVDVAQARPVSSRAEAAIVEKLSYHRQHSEKKNTELMKRISNPIVRYFRETVFAGKRDFVPLTDDLEEIAANAQQESRQIQESTVDKLSRKKIENLDDKLARKTIINAQIQKDFPALSMSDRAVFTAIFEDIEEYNTFRSRPYVKEAIKDETVKEFLDVFTGTSSESNIPFEERSLFSRYLTEGRTGTRDATAHARRLQQERDEKTARELKETTAAQRQKEIDDIAKFAGPTPIGSRTWRRGKIAVKNFGKKTLSALGVVGAGALTAMYANKAIAAHNIITDYGDELTEDQRDELNTYKHYMAGLAGEEATQLLPFNPIPVTRGDIRDFKMMRKAKSMARDDIREMVLAGDFPEETEEDVEAFTVDPSRHVASEHPMLLEEASKQRRIALEHQSGIMGVGPRGRAIKSKEESLKDEHFLTLDKTPKLSDFVGKKRAAELQADLMLRRESEEKFRSSPIRKLRERIQSTKMGDTQEEFLNSISST